MERLIIEDNYNKWFRKIADNFDEKVLMSYNWKDLFKKMEHILKSPFSDFQIRVEVFAFLNRIIDMNFLKKDSEIKSYFNNIMGVIVNYTTDGNVRNFFIIIIKYYYRQYLKNML
jgi:hypothetical protein